MLTIFEKFTKQDAQIGHGAGRAHWEGQQQQQKQVKSITELPSSPSSQSTASPPHMHDKVSVVDRFRFWFSSRNSFQGTKSIVMQTSIVFGPNFRWGSGSLWGAPPVKESQASDSIM